jgi:hypothetical protein
LVALASAVAYVVSSGVVDAARSQRARSGDAPAVRIRGVVEQFRIAGQPDLVVRSTHHTAKVVVYLHGSGENQDAMVTDPLKRPLSRALLDHGYSIAASYAHGENWGDPASVADYTRLIARLRGEGLTKLYILAQSMGGLDALQLIPRETITAWAAIYPVVDVRSLARAIRGPGAAMRRAMSAANLSPARVADARGLPMIFWSSPHDTLVLKKLNTDVAAAEASRDGARVTVLSTTGQHGDPSNFQPLRLLAFFAG